MNRTVLLLAALLVVAADLRMHGLHDQGFFMFDEARYLLEAGTLREQIREVSTRASAATPTSPSVVEGMARPLHVLILAAASSVPMALWIMAGFGLASVILVHEIARRAAVFDEQGSAGRVGLIAAFLLAFSPSHIFHSRTLLAEVDAVFFLLLAVWIYLGDSARPRLFLCGLSFGLAIIAQSRMAMSVPFFLAWDAAKHRSIPRLAFLVAGLSLPIAGVETFYQVLRALLHIAGQGESFMTYFEQFLHRHKTDIGHMAFNRPWFGLSFLVHTESLIITISFLAGLFLALRRRSPHASLLGLYACFVLAVASLYDQDHHSGFRWGRAVAPALPFVLILAAFFLDHCARRFRRGSVLLGALLTITLLIRSGTLMELRTMHSDQQEILARAVDRFPAPHYFSEEPLHIRYFLGGEKLPRSFIPRADTLTVILFDPGYARNFGFTFYLPDSPTHVISNRSHRPSRLMLAETVGREDLTLEPMHVPDALIYVLPPADTPAGRLRRMF